MSHIRPWECQCKHCWRKTVAELGATDCSDISEKRVVSLNKYGKPNQQPLVSSPITFLKMSEIIIGGSICVLMFGKHKKKSI